MGAGCPSKYPPGVNRTLLVHPSPPIRLPGYRHIHLLSKNGDQHPSATLFVKVALQD